MPPLLQLRILPVYPLPDKHHSKFLGAILSPLQSGKNTHLLPSRLTPSLTPLPKENNPVLPSPPPSSPPPTGLHCCFLKETCAFLIRSVGFNPALIYSDIEPLPCHVHLKYHSAEENNSTTATEKCHLISPLSSCRLKAHSTQLGYNPVTHLGDRTSEPEADFLQC